MSDSRNQQRGTAANVSREELWPALPYDAWKDTYATLHMWSQIVGKIALALAPPINHSWGVSLRVTARGIATAPLPYDSRSFTMEFDFVSHELIVQATDGQRRALKLEPRTVADTYREIMAMLTDMRLPVKIWPTAVEIPDPPRLDTDIVHHAYDPEYANRFWRILVQVERVFADARCEFVGKCSPVQFFWGSFDLAVTRFSGRPAPPRDGPAFMQEAYSHEVISHGFWPGSGPILEPAFYAYAVPEPDGLKTAPVSPSAAYYHRELNEFILPYDAVRKADSPAWAIAEFVRTTYEQAATLGKWDRAALDRAELPGRPVTV
jgi:Family of unknown function (DUF5996)